MHIPLWSTFTLATELVVTGFVYFIIYDAYRRSIFRAFLAFAVLAYEAIFNITYMASRLLQATPAVNEPHITGPYETGLAIFHGTFSLIMFVMLVAFFLYAARAYGRAQNYFREHRILTGIFCAAWFVSIFSGVLFFVALSRLSNCYFFSGVVVAAFSSVESCGKMP